MDYNGLVEGVQLAINLVSGGTDAVEKLRKLTQRPDKSGIPPAQVAELTLEIQNKLIDARFAQLSLLDMLRDLKSEMIEMDRRLELQNKYEPTMTAGGALVLAMKSGDGRGEPPHYICPDCAEAGRRSFLQPQGTGKQCHPCGKFFAFVVAETGAFSVRRHDPLEPYGA